MLIVSKIGLKWQGVCSNSYVIFTIYRYMALNFWGKICV
jgi:hypothetical protein